MIRRSARRPASPIRGIVIGTIGLAFAGWMFAGAQADLRTYIDDPSCGVTASIAPAAGQCRTESMRIDRVYRTSGRGAQRRIVLVRGDGSQLTVVYRHDRYGNVWSGATRRADRTASAQYFRNALVAVTTQSGLAETDAMPAERVNQWAFVGIAAGAIGFFSTIVELLRLPRTQQAS